MQCFLKSKYIKVELSVIKIGELLRKLWSLRSCFLILPPGPLAPQGIKGAVKCDVSKHWCTLQWCARRGWVIAHENWTSCDGPHEIFPTILRKCIGPRGFTSFDTSAHYCLVFMVSETLYNTTVIRYNAVFVVYTTLTLNTPTQLVFDNNTRCNDNTNQVRSCVFKIRAPDDSNVKLTLTEIQIKGVNMGIDFAAGFVVYNVVGGRPERSANCSRVRSIFLYTGFLSLVQNL